MGPHSSECGNDKGGLGMGWRYRRLQWGRTHLSAETGAGRAAWPARKTGFNGAALILVRKRATAPTRTLSDHPASMGPHSSECGNGPLLLRRGRHAYGFNGAALI